MGVWPFMITGCTQTIRIGFSFGLLAFVTACFSGASAGIPADSQAWQIRGAEDANFGEVRSEYGHQPNINCDIARNPYSRVRKISKFSLYGDPSAYEERMIGVIGYLFKSKGCEGQTRLYLFPTRETYELGYPRECLSITLNPHFKGVEKFESGKTIEAIGVFKRAHQSTVEQVFGSLEDASIRVLRPVSN